MKSLLAIAVVGAAWMSASPAQSTQAPPAPPAPHVPYVSPAPTPERAAELLAAAESAPIPSFDPATDLFIDMCLNHFIAKGFGLEERMAREKRTPLRAEAASAFLEGEPGKAWQVMTTPTHAYVASISDKNVCRVYARVADRDEVWKNFERAARAYFPLWEPLPLPDFAAMVRKPGAAPGPRRQKEIYFSTPLDVRTPIWSVVRDDSPNAGFAVRFTMSFDLRKDIERVLDILRQREAKATQ